MIITSYQTVQFSVEGSNVSEVHVAAWNMARNACGDGWEVHSLAVGTMKVADRILSNGSTVMHVIWESEVDAVLTSGG